MARAGRTRLDLLLVARGLARSRERARALLMAGVVRVDGTRADKAGTLISDDAKVTVIAPDHPYVGRGGVKLRGALDALHIDPDGRVGLDIGASTGGFTDCLLRSGARKVYALDVGSGQLDWTLRNDGRVVVLEGLNARYLQVSDLPEPVDLVVIDVSFISLRLILPPLPPLLTPGGEVVALVKPQFEVGRREVGAGGIVREPEKHLDALNRVAVAAGHCGFRVEAASASAITGAEGNQEFFLHLRPGKASSEVYLKQILGGIIHGG